MTRKEQVAEGEHEERRRDFTLREREKARKVFTRFYAKNSFEESVHSQQQQQQQQQQQVLKS